LGFIIQNGNLLYRAAESFFWWRIGKDEYAVLWLQLRGNFF